MADGLWSSVVLLLHCDGSDGGTTFTDEAGHTVTAGGNAHTEIDQYRFGTASLQLDGSGDYLTSADSTDWDLGIDDFCIEFWGRSVNKGGASAGILFGQAANLGAATASWAIYHSGSAISFSATTGTASWNVINISGSDSTAATWRHYCVERYGSTVTVYVDGLSKASGTPAASFSNASHALRIGDGTDGSNPISGYIDEIRFTKAARYKGEFTPPTVPFDNTDIASSAGAATGTATASGVGAALADEGAGLSAGTSTVTGVAKAIAKAAGSAAGTSTVAGYGGVGTDSAIPTGWFYSKTAGTDYLHRAVPASLDQEKWSFATWLYLPASFDPDYEAIFAFLNDDDGGIPDSERTLQFGATLGFLGWYDGTNWSWWELDSALPTQMPVCIQFDYDSVQATAADRLRLYVNGVRQDYQVGYSNPPAQYADTYSGFTDPELVLSGYMLGVAGGGETAAYLSPVIMQSRSLFVSGANPSAADIYAGTLPGSYGTAGWLLEYDTPATLGADTSGNDNDWTLAGDSADSWIGLYPTTASLQFGGPLDGYAVRVVIQISAVETYAVTADIDIDPPTYAVTAGIRISGEETYAVTATIAIQGSMHTAANRTSLVWTPLVEIGGSDVSSRLTGEIRIEHNEDASNVASFTLLPATGPIDPLGYLNDQVQITWRDAGDGTYVSHDVLRFTGVIVDARWSPDAGTLDIEATSDLQGVVEAMDRDAIADMVGGTWSDIVFDAEADAWTYAQDRLSTTTDTLWQDGAGHLRKAALAAKASPDFTFTDAGRFSDTLAIETASLRDLVNEITITLDYRFPRKRHRQIRVRWKGQQDICTFLANPYTLCQRDMVQAAAEGGGWSVVGDISYTAVWPPGAYQCGGGINGVSVWGYSPIVAQLDSYQDLSAWCMGATWSAARRWAQSITETHTVVVQCQDSIDAVGVLPRAEDYGTESDVDLSDWEESDAGEGPPAGALQLASGDWAVDADEEGDIDRDAVDEALEVAMAAARGDILRSHRANRVSFQTVFQPAVKLSHTVRVNTPYLVARGKVVRIEDLLSIDGGDATSTIEIAVSRHEGTGLSASDPIAAPAKPTAADGAAIPNLITLRQYTGGQMADYESPGFEADSYAEIEGEGGYFTNVLYNGEVNYTIGVDQVDPQLEAKIYPEQFVVNYPEISGAHIDAVEAVTTTTIEVAVPEDELTLAA